MVQIQFLNNGELLTPNDQSPIAITKSIAEIKDLSKRKGSFSKTIVINGSKDANRVLGHYYDINIKNSTFNRKALTPVRILEDGISVLEGNLRLLNISNISKIGTFDSEVEYEVIVYDANVDFFQAIRTKKLTEIDLSEFDHTYSAANIIASFNNTDIDGYKYAFGLMDDNTYELKDLKPAIYVRQIWDKIFANAGFSYQWASMDNDDIQFSKLLLPYVGEPLKFTGEDLVEFYAQAEDNSLQTFNSDDTATGLVSTNNGQQNPWVQLQATLPADITSNYHVLASNELVDEGGNYDPITSVYSSPLSLTGSNSMVINYELTLDVLLDFTNEPPSETAYIYSNHPQGITYNVYPAPNEIGWKYNIRLYVVSQNDVVLAWKDIEGPSVISTQASPFSIVGGNTYTVGSVNTSGTIQCNNIAVIPTDLRIIAVLNPEIENNFNAYYDPRFMDANGVSQSVYNEIQITYSKLTFYPNPESFSFGATMSLNKLLPKMDQTEFIKGILNIYNLYLEADPNSPNSLIIKTRDEYYDGGVAKDWTPLICKDEKQNIRFASEESKRNKVLKWKTGKSILNKEYQDFYNEIYGQYTYILDDRNLKDTDTIEVPFSPMPIAKTSFGAYVLGMDGFAPKENPTLVIDGGLRTCDPYNIVNYFDNGTAFGELNQTQIPYIGHLNDPITPNFDLNYFLPISFFYGDIQTLTANNMFNLHWRRTFSQIANASTLEAYFYLDAEEFSKIKLNDKIYVHDSLFNIIEIRDYVANGKKPTLVKLIQVDDNIALGNSSQQPDVITNPGGGGIALPPIVNNPLLPFPEPLTPVFPGGINPAQENKKSINKVITEVIKNKNIDLGTNNVVTGKYNVLNENSKNNVVTGNFNIVGSEGSVVTKNGTLVSSTYAIDTESISLNEIDSDDTNIIIVSNNASIDVDNQSYSFIIGSDGALIDGSGDRNSILSSRNSTIFESSTQNSIISASTSYIKPVTGLFGDLTAWNNTIIGGFTNKITREPVGVGPFGDSYLFHNSIIAGRLNEINGQQMESNISLGGRNNVINCEGSLFASGIKFSSILGGELNQILSQANVLNNCIIVGGDGNTIIHTDAGFTAASENNQIFGGSGNIVAVDSLNEDDVIIGGLSNLIDTSERCAIISGSNNDIINSSRRSTIINGNANTIDDSLGSTILGGGVHSITTADDSVIVGGINNTITGVNRSVILGGTGITATQADTAYADQFVIVTSFTPANSADPAGVVGQITWDNAYVYVKTGVGWGRAALAAF